MENYLGIELGSTRIKAMAIDGDHIPIFQGDYYWSSRCEGGIWTYDLEEAWKGLRVALGSIMARDSIKAMGISGMMHGYLAFDKDWRLLTPFRTWQNTITAEAASKLSALFEFNIPERWSIAHLYQAILNREPHIEQIAHITTLAGYIHYMLTGVNALGIGEASGMFPIDSETLSYDKKMLEKFSALPEVSALPWQVESLLPRVLIAGEPAGRLTEKGARLLGDLLPAGIPFAPPEGDAGTGMTATNAVEAKKGNISAGTSVFAMVVLEQGLKNIYEEIDIVATPDGKPVAMVHCNNCTADLNAWISLIKEALKLFGLEPSANELYTKLYEKALDGAADCGGIAVCNYMAGESITKMEQGRPMVVRQPEERFALGNFMRAQLYSAVATLKIGMEILAKERVEIAGLVGHGGFFKTPIVGQRIMAAACNAPITVMTTAGEGGPYGMALLAAFSAKRGEGESLSAYLADKVFKDARSATLTPDHADIAGFERYMERYERLLKIEKIAVEEF